MSLRTASRDKLWIGIRGLDSKGVFSLVLTQLISPSALTEGDILLLTGYGARCQERIKLGLGMEAVAFWEGDGGKRGKGKQEEDEGLALPAG